jgi:hypothetical protein
LRGIGWASWDGAIKAWRIPYRSLEQLRQRWAVIEAAALRDTSEARRERRAALGAQQHPAVIERWRHRFPVPADQLPPEGKVVMTSSYGAVIFTEITGELVDDAVLKGAYPQVAADDGLIWGHWRTPSLAELVEAWPSRVGIKLEARRRGWWDPDLEELRAERRAARSRERAQATRSAQKKNH